MTDVIALASKNDSFWEVKMHFKNVLTIIIVFLCFSNNVLAYSGGDGTAANPYQIANVNDFLELSNTPNDWSRFFILTADIDLTGLTFNQAPIAPDIDSVTSGFQGTKFTGAFDGNGHIISNLIIHAPTNDYIGLFGIIDVSYRYQPYGEQIFNIGIVQNLRIDNSTLTGRARVGGLVGENRSLLIACHATGSVMATGSYVGGLVGYNSGSINACYSNGSVITNGNIAGGLVGYNYRSITTCYSTCLVGGTLVGGFVGVNNSGDGAAIISCFWDTQTSGQVVGVGNDNGISTGLTGLSTTKMKTLSTFTDAGWDFISESANGLHDYWQLESNDYPRFALHTWTLDGEGTSTNPYLVANATDLGKVWLRPSACYRLGGNLDLTGITWLSAVIPAFTGVFDGYGFVVSNLTINLPVGDYIGLFGRVYLHGQVMDVGLENVEIIGRSNVGGLAGANVGYFNSEQSTLAFCYATGSVSGNSYVGGLVGRNDADIISCHANASVVGTEENSYSVGGLVGWNNKGSLTLCYSDSSVNGQVNVGGLVGYNREGSLTSCWATGSVSSGEFSGCIGGLIGGSYRSSITSCYATGPVCSGEYSSQVGGLMGEAGVDTINFCYSTGLVSVPNVNPSYYDYVGGFLGAYGADQMSLTACFWDVQASGQSVGVGTLGTPLGLAGKSTEEMTTLSTFTDIGWDFVETWVMLDGNYPRLISLHNTLCIQTNPSFITSVRPAVGQYTVSGVVDISAMRFSECPDVYQFDHWEGDVDDSDAASTMVFVDSNKTITAVFSIATPVCGDECHSNFAAGDLNHDCIVDLADFAIFASTWMNCIKPECD